MRLTVPTPLALATGVLGLLTGLPSAQNVREIHVDGKSSVARVWSENGKNYYSVSLDGRTFQPVQETSYELALRFEEFDPVLRDAAVPEGLVAGPSSRLFIVQYWTQGLEDYREVLRERGVEIHRFLANHANIVEMDRGVAAEIEELSFVRSVRPFHPAFKLEEELIDQVRAGANGPLTVNLLTMRRGGHAPVVEWIEGMGGVVEEISKETYFMTATIERSLLSQLASLDTVQWIDRWSAPETDMNIARQMHGADYVGNNFGFTGQDVRAEVMDSGCDNNHPDLPNFIVHNNNTPSSHGTSTSGILFGKGIANANATGAMPDGFLVVARYSGGFSGGSRYAHSGELQNPALAYKCVLQSNSWGSSQVTNYNSISQDMDLILFDHSRLSILQSQSNLNGRRSRPQAWAKNIVAVGGINHRNTLTKSDDFWGGASIGPAEDGRIKPDMASYYDSILTTNNGGGYTTSFGGTSGATPIIAGHMGLFYQMWGDGVFNNSTPGSSTFENRPQNTTAKAVMINTASQWSFSGTNHNLTRTHQGWGHADLQRMHQQAGTMLVVDETDVLAPFESQSYFVQVAGSSSSFRATMVYRDPAGTTSSNLHRINNLNLTVISPDGTTYKGNNGLDAGETSTPNGKWNKVDTVENVFVSNPLAGEWQIIVTAAEVNQDSHVETGALDVDFALAVSGIQSTNASCTPPRVLTRTAGANANTYTASTPQVGTPVNFTVGTNGFSFATIYGLAQPDYRPLDASGTVLVNPDFPPLFVIGPLNGPTANASMVVANDPSMCGMVIYTQAKLDNGPGPFQVTNSQDLVIGL